MELQCVLAYIHNNLDRDLRLEVLAGLANLSPHHFCRAFHLALGVSPHQYVMRARVDKARQLLESGQESIVDIALDLGFSHQSHFTCVFRRLMGITPKKYQRTLELAPCQLSQDAQDMGIADVASGLLTLADPWHGPGTVPLLLTAN